MDIQIQADNYHISEYVDQCAKKTAAKLIKRFNNIINCELIVLVPKHTFSAHADHELMPAAIEMTIPKIEKQLARYKANSMR